jgi:hypothetical protein
MLEVNALSCLAKANGDLPTMYAANRAWRELHDAYKDLKNRRAALSPAQRETPKSS